MHSEICPICNGRGWICKEYPASPPCKDKKKCYGCDGKGWISVHDSYPYYYPPYTITWQTHNPYYQVTMNIKVSYDSLNPYLDDLEGGT